MKVPPAPPSTDDIVLAALRRDPARFATLMRTAALVDAHGRYLHWDELRRKTPPEPLTAEEWWAATRLARAAASQTLPLLDMAGRAFSFCEPPALKAALRDLDMNAGGALTTGVGGLSAGEGQQYLVRSLAEEPFSSSFIEGAATTRQIAKKLIFEQRQPRTKDERMVLNNYRAMAFVKAHKADALSVDMVCEMHRIVTEDTLNNPADAGRVRSSDDIRVMDEIDNEVLHQPPPATSLPDRLKRMITFANERPDESRWTHPLVRAFVLHFMLSYEHPFVDGNGRVARALFYWSALRDGYWLMEYVSISSVIAEAVVDYGKAFLRVETDASDLTYFLIHQAAVLQTAIARLTAFAERKQKEVAALEQHLANRTRDDALNHRQSWLLNELLRDRLAQVTVGEHGARHGVSYLTARTDLERLVDAGFLLKSKSGRSSFYRSVSNLAKKLTGVGR